MSADPQSAILVHLFYAGQQSVAQIASATGVSSTTVRNHLRVMQERGSSGGNPWVQSLSGPGLKATLFSLTSRGEQVAGYRNDARKNRSTR